jgi:CubicO group peptidase (beta-lactamase class C family)
MPSRAWWLVATILISACARAPRAAPSSSPADSLPVTPAGTALAGWLSSYNGANHDSLVAFVRRAYAASELQARPPEVVARGQRLWRQNYGRFDFLRVDTSSAHSVDGFVRQGLTGALSKVYVEIDSQPPHGITGVYLLPFAKPPADLVVTARRSDAQLAGELRDYTAKLLDADVLSGAVALYRGATPLLEQGIGLARREPPVPNDLEMRFELASLSKLFTAVAIAQLVENGLLRFETTLGEVLPDYPNRETATRITVHQLLTHTSGLPDFYRNGKIRQIENSIRSLADYYPAFALDSLWGVPGRAFDYSNSNYIVLGAIIERLSKVPFETYVERHIFTPAGMTATCYCEAAPRRATQYSRYTSGFGPTRRAEPDRWIEVPTEARRPGAPAGGGISTARDIARFGSALLTNRLVSAAMFARMTTPYVSMGGEGHKGYGFEVHDWFGTRFVGHGGNFWGVMSQIDIYPATGHIAVVLSNNDASGGEAVRNWTRRALAGVQIR